MLKLAIPLIHVANAAAAEEFYCNRLVFGREFAHRADPAKSDPCYLGISHDGIWMRVSSFSGDGLAGGVVNFLVDSVDALHAKFVKKGVPIAVEPVNQVGHAGNIREGRRWQQHPVHSANESHPLGDS